MFCSSKARAACFLAACSLLCNAVSQAQPLDRATQYDLELHSDSGTTLGHMIAKTITNSGKKTFDDFLCNPIDDSQQLQARQAVIRHMADNPDLMRYLSAQLGSAAETEYYLQSTKDELGKKSLERVYFKRESLKRLNSSTLALDCAYLFAIIGTCAPLIEHIIMHLGISALFNAAQPKKAHKHADHDHGKKKHVHHAGCGHDHGDPNNKLTYYGLQVFHWGLHAPSLYDMGNDIHHKASMVQYVQNRLIKVARYVDAAEQSYRMLRESGADTLSMQAYQNLDYFFGDDAQASAEFKRLRAKFKSNTFSGEASLFNHPGKVLSAYHLFCSVEQELEQLQYAMSQIDCYLCAARFITQATEEQPWCFVQFNHDKKPYLKVDKLRHLFVESSVPFDYNSMDAGKQLVIGENGCGKSTYLFGLAHAVLLAQTFGIVPAQACAMTPFSHLYTYRFIQDDMVAGVSRFYAECARADQILEAVERQPGHSFIIFDEPYTYTNSKKGVGYVAQLMQRLTHLDTALCAVATHYEKTALPVSHKWGTVRLDGRG